jgi:hypothetical protein
MKKKFADKLLLLLLLVVVATPLHTGFNVIQSIYCPINWFANCCILSALLTVIYSLLLPFKDPHQQLTPVSSFGINQLVFQDI